MKGKTMNPKIETLIQRCKKHKDWLIILLVAFLGVYFVHNGLEKHKKNLGLDTAMMDVLVAKQSMEQGDRFSVDHLSIEQIPEKYVPIGALIPSDAMKFQGQEIKRTINQGEIILSNALDVEFSIDNPSSKIQEGYRALSVPVDEISSISHALRAGDHVDLMATLQLDNGPNTTLTLLQNVTVLAVGSSLSHASGYSQASSYATITLMVLPKEAPLIMHALQTNEISIVVRNPYDQETSTDLPMISKKDLIQAGFLNHLQQERNSTITILRGQAENFDF
jgi:pilus assembly protein CpaB